MKKTELRQLYWLKREIEIITERIARLERAMEGGVQHLSGFPRTKGVTDRIGDLAPELARLRDLAEEKLKMAMGEYLRLHQFIDAIPDAQLRLVFSLRYIDGHSWQGVANRVGGNTADSVRMMHNRYLAGME